MNFKRFRITEVEVRLADQVPDHAGQRVEVAEDHTCHWLWTESLTRDSGRNRGLSQARKLAVRRLVLE